MSIENWNYQERPAQVRHAIFEPVGKVLSTKNKQNPGLLKLDKLLIEN